MALPQSARQRSHRRFFELAGICLAVAAIGWFVFPRVPVISKADWIARDQVIAATSRREAAEDFVFLAIDESTLKLDQLWPEDLAASSALRAMAQGFPWSRAVYAEAIDRLVAAGARLVILDLLLDKPRDGDAELRAVLDRHPRRVLLGANYALDARGQPAMTVPTPTLIAEPATDPRVGYVNFFTNSDGLVRELAPVTTLGERIGQPPLPGEATYRSLAAASLRQLGVDWPEMRASRPLPFRYAASGVATYPLQALFVPWEWKQKLRSGEIFRGKIVMIGPSATRLQDFHVTPIGRLPGPLLHVVALSSALHRDFYRLGGPADRIGLVGFAALAALALAWWLRRNPLLSFLSLLGTAIAFLGGTYATARWGDYVPHALYPLLTLFVAGTSGIAWNFAQERRESGRMRSMLERYVSRNLVREVLDHREDFLNALGGTRRPMTVFFSDVRGFTSFSERADAGVVVEQLNEYLGEMVGVIFRHHGTVDKFMGDGIMAVWGNVVSKGPAADAEDAIGAALEMLARLARLNESWTARDLPSFTIGIGLHHGEAVFGNIGSAEKMEPTVIGDTVNLASRVEGLTKKYGVALCVTAPLADLVNEAFVFRSVDLVQVVGKSRPVEILTVLGRRGSGDAAAPAWLATYEAAVADFRARRFAEAAAQFRLTASAIPSDRLCGIYLSRCEAFLAEPPPEGWTGAEVATSK